MSLSSKIKVICSKGHRFPVNLDKNKNRDYVLCPRCKDKVIVRKAHIFSPNPTWQKEKVERMMERRVEKRKRQKKGEPVQLFTPSMVRQAPIEVVRVLTSVFRVSMKEAVEEEKVKKSEQKRG